MFTSLKSMGLRGIDGFMVDVEADLSQGLPGFDVVGPTGSFAQYSDFSKLVLAFAMLLGRLEIFPLLLTFIPSAWHRK